MTATKHDDTCDGSQAMFFILRGSKRKYICPPLFFNVQIKMSNPSHYRPAGNHGKWNSARAQRAALVGAWESSRGHMERWIRLLSDSVFSLVLGLQLTVMIRRDRCLSVWTRKTMSNGAFDVLLYLLCCLTFQNPDYFNESWGTLMLGHTLRLYYIAL